jgi:hypothetical protein
LSWTAVAGASKYQVFRTEGLEQCGQGKVLLATLSSSTRTFTDEGLANKREYYYIVLPKGPNDSCFGRSSACAPVTPAAGPGFELQCDNEPLTVPADSRQSSAHQRNCVLYGTGGERPTLHEHCLLGCFFSLISTSCHACRFLWECKSGL